MQIRFVDPFVPEGLRGIGALRAHMLSHMRSEGEKTFAWDLIDYFPHSKSSSSSSSSSSSGRFTLHLRLLMGGGGGGGQRIQVLVLGRTKRSALLDLTLAYDRTALITTPLVRSSSFSCFSPPDLTSLLLSSHITFADDRPALVITPLIRSSSSSSLLPSFHSSLTQIVPLHSFQFLSSR